MDDSREFFALAIFALSYGFLAFDRLPLIKLDRVSGVLVGAVGVSGDTGPNDELCSVAGIEAAGLGAQL